MNASLIRPEIGQWYAHADKGELFQVVGRDDQSRTIEIQYFDGDVDEIDAEMWATLPIEPTEPPEDMTAPMDDIETDDLGYSDTGMIEAEWQEPLQSLKWNRAGKTPSSKTNAMRSTRVRWRSRSRWMSRG